MFEMYKKLNLTTQGKISLLVSCGPALLYVGFIVFLYVALGV